MKKIMPSRPDWFLSCLRSRHEVQSFGGITIQKVERLDENVIQEFQSTLFYSPDWTRCDNCTHRPASTLGYSLSHHPGNMLYLVGDFFRGQRELACEFLYSDHLVWGLSSYTPSLTIMDRTTSKKEHAIETRHVPTANSESRARTEQCNKSNRANIRIIQVKGGVKSNV